MIPAYKPFNANLSKHQYQVIHTSKKFCIGFKASVFFWACSWAVRFDLAFALFIRDSTVAFRYCTGSWCAPFSLAFLTTHLHLCIVYPFLCTNLSVILRIVITYFVLAFRGTQPYVPRSSFTRKGRDPKSSTIGISLNFGL